MVEGIESQPLLSKGMLCESCKSTTTDGDIGSVSDLLAAATRRHALQRTKNTTRKMIAIWKEPISNQRCNDHQVLGHGHFQINAQKESEKLANANTKKRSKRGKISANN
jgi:hypothetical protein